MIDRMTLAGLAICSLLAPLGATDKRIAVTFDDLPCVRCSDFDSMARTNAEIIRILSVRRIPAIGFVNERKLYTDGAPDARKVSILRDWLRAGLELGNHTFSHVTVHKVAVAEYERDLLAGEAITRPLMKAYGKPLRYFRPPLLQTGLTAESKAQVDAVLSRHGYRTAPVTIDSDEYIYALCYDKAKDRKDRDARRRISADYLDYMKRTVGHYEELSLEFLGYRPPQVLLLHVNELNADHLESLIEMLRDGGYGFIPLEVALEDPAFRLPEAVHEKGLSWIERWRLAQGLAMKNPPAVSDWVLKMAENEKSD